jgi:hypothetical protein
MMWHQQLDELIRSYDMGLSITAPRVDNASIFVENQLKHIVTQTYNELYAVKDARTHVPVVTDVPPGARQWGYDSYRGGGRPRWIGANATDIPRAEVSAQRITFPIEGFALGYGYSMQDIRAAQFAGIGLDAEKARVTRRAMMEFEHDALFVGDASLQVPGFFNNPSVQSLVLPNGNWLNPATTADQILEDLRVLADEVFLASGETLQADTILLPRAHKLKIAQLRIPDTGMTVEQFFLANSPFIRAINMTADLATAGVGSGPRAISYVKDPSVVRGVVPMPFTQHQPQIQGFEFLIPVEQTCGGTVMVYPVGAVYADGI